MEPATRTRFDDLPPELRQKIWSLILPGPRLVTVNHFSKAPLALHINRESRFIALKHYELLHPQHLEHAKHTNAHRCVKGYIEFRSGHYSHGRVDACEDIDQKICHLQDNCWLWQHISSTRTFLMTDSALTKFLRVRSYKLMIHFDPNIRGVEYQNLPGRLTETGFQRKVDAAVRTISTRIDAIKASKALEGVNWEPPTYSFVRCGLDAAGLKCEKPGSCDGRLDAGD